MKGTEYGLWLRRQEIPFNDAGDREADQLACADYAPDCAVVRLRRQRARAHYARRSVSPAGDAARSDRAPAGMTARSDIRWAAMVIMTMTLLIVVCGLVL